VFKSRSASVRGVPGKSPVGKGAAEPSGGGEADGAARSGGAEGRAAVDRPKVVLGTV